MQMFEELWCEIVYFEGPQGEDEMTIFNAAITRADEEDFRTEQGPGQQRPEQGNDQADADHGDFFDFRHSIALGTA